MPCTDMFRHVQTCTDMFRHVQTCTDICIKCILPVLPGLDVLGVVMVLPAGVTKVRYLALQAGDGAVHWGLPGISHVRVQRSYIGEGRV